MAESARKGTKPVKYIVVKAAGGMECAVLFDELLTHAEVAGVGRKVVSAGFCDAAGRVFGKSGSLRKRCRKKDGELVRHAVERGAVWAA